MADATILDVMDHPDGLGPFFKGDTWGAWRVFLAALFALPMDADALALYRHHTARETAPAVAFTEAALACGRRGGKSRVLALIAVYLATLRDYTPYLAPGEVATIAVIASDKKQARSIFRYVTGMLHSSPSFKATIEEEQAGIVTLSNRVVIEITAASLRATRGYTFAAVLCDEIAFWRTEEGSANPDTEILSAIRPGLTTIPGAMLLLASSPYSRRGALYETFRDYYGRDDAEVLVWRGTTREMNPSVPQREIDKAYARDAASAAAEHGAEFRNDIGAFVPRDVIDALVMTGRREMLPVSGTRYVAFVDPSGGSSDSMTLAIAHKVDDCAVLDALREAHPPFSPEAVVADFAATLASYSITKVTGDRYAGEWAREPFRKVGIDYVLTDKAKSDIYRDTLPLLNSGKVELLDNPRLVAQFCGLERRTARGGRDSIDHAPGAHDDLVNSVAGALLLALAGRGPLVISSAALERSRQTTSRFARPRQFSAYGGAR